MSETAIHENGISMILCNICNTYPDFRKDFFSLFSNFPHEKEIEYMYFTGDNETNFGKPDITIRFDDGDFFLIEVKTKNKTAVQGNQEFGLKDEKTKEKGGYIGLIEYLGQKVEDSYAFLVDQWHPGFEEDTKKIGENGEFSVPVVTWNKVAECLNNYQNNHTIKPQKNKLAFFVEDLEKNVDGFDKGDNFSSISKDELSFISNPSDISKCINIFNRLRELELEPNYELKQKGKPTFSFQILNGSYEHPNFRWYINVSKELENDSQKHINYKNWLWIGFDTCYLAKDKNAEINSKNKSDVKYLFGISVYGDLLSQKKLIKDKVEFYKDINYYYYFPLNEEYTKIVEKIDSDEDLQNIFKDYIMNKVKDIFKNYLPNNTRRINIKLWEK